MFDGLILEHVPTMAAVSRVRPGAAGHHVATGPLSFMDAHSNGGA
jgi:hypothetical protein